MNFDYNNNKNNINFSNDKLTQFFALNIVVIERNEMIIIVANSSKLVPVPFYLFIA
jgi:hypothetical protein